MIYPYLVWNFCHSPHPLCTVSESLIAVSLLSSWFWTELSHCNKIIQNIFYFKERFYWIFMCVLFKAYEFKQTIFLDSISQLTDELSRWYWDGRIKMNIWIHCLSLSGNKLVKMKNNDFFQRKITSFRWKITFFLWKKVLFSKRISIFSSKFLCWNCE